jgi:hypothetical protein
MDNNKDLIKNLVTLSTIFKKGFIVKYNNGNLQQYNNVDKPYIVSIKTIVEIKPIAYKSLNVLNMPNGSIIGGWFDIDNNTYMIEINKAYKNKHYALSVARKYKQRFIYDLLNGVCIKT